MRADPSWTTRARSRCSGACRPICWGWSLGARRSAGCKRVRCRSAVGSPRSAGCWRPRTRARSRAVPRGPRALAGHPVRWLRPVRAAARHRRRGAARSRAVAVRRGLPDRRDGSVLRWIVCRVRRADAGRPGAPGLPSGFRRFFITSISIRTFGVTRSGAWRARASGLPPAASSTRPEPLPGLISKRVMAEPRHGQGRSSCVRRRRRASARTTCALSARGPRSAMGGEGETAALVGRQVVLAPTPVVLGVRAAVPSDGGLELRLAAALSSVFKPGRSRLAGVGISDVGCLPSPYEARRSGPRGRQARRSRMGSRPSRALDA